MSSLFDIPHAISDECLSRLDSPEVLLQFSPDDVVFALRLRDLSLRLQAHILSPESAWQPNALDYYTHPGVPGDVEVGLELMDDADPAAKRVEIVVFSSRIPQDLICFHTSNHGLVDLYLSGSHSEFSPRDYGKPRYAHAWRSHPTLAEVFLAFATEFTSLTQIDLYEFLPLA